MLVGTIVVLLAISAILLFVLRSLRLGLIGIGFRIQPVAWHTDSRYDRFALLADFLLLPLPSPAIDRTMER